MPLEIFVLKAIAQSLIYANIVSILFHPLNILTFRFNYQKKLRSLQKVKVKVACIVYFDQDETVSMFWPHRIIKLKVCNQPGLSCIHMRNWINITTLLWTFYMQYLEPFCSLNISTMARSKSCTFAFRLYIWIDLYHYGGHDKDYEMIIHKSLETNT